MKTEERQHYTSTHHGGNNRTTVTTENPNHWPNVAIFSLHSTRSFVLFMRGRLVCTSVNGLDYRVLPVTLTHMQTSSGSVRQSSWKLKGFNCIETYRNWIFYKIWIFCFNNYHTTIIIIDWGKANIVWGFRRFYLPSYEWSMKSHHWKHRRQKPKG